MDWKDVAGAVTKSAPILGTILGGPVGGAIGGVISLLGSAFGLTPAETTPERINDLLKYDSTAAIKLAEIESTHKIRLQELLLDQSRLDLEREKAEFADMASARAREVEVVKTTGSLDINLYVLAWTVVAGFFALIYVLTFQELPSLNVGPVNQLYGVMGTGFGVVLSYFFGSSRGSMQKSAMLDNRAAQAASTAATAATEATIAVIAAERKP